MRRLTLLVAGLLAAGCAVVPVVAVRLPEPTIPACLVEEAPAPGRAVGIFEFEAAWVKRTLSLGSQNAILSEVFRCASDVAKSLRESIGIIRTFNSN